MELAPGEECSNGCEQVGQWASKLLRVRELVQNRIWKSHRVQLHINVDCGCRVVDIANVNAAPPPAERAGCAGKQRRYVCNSSANISTIICQDTPWSPKMFSSSRSRGEAEPRDKLAHEDIWKIHRRAGSDVSMVLLSFAWGETATPAIPHRSYHRLEHRRVATHLMQR